MNTPSDRRKFLKQAAILTGSIYFLAKTENVFGSGISSKYRNEIPNLNPAFRANIYSGNVVELYTFDGEKNKISYNFSGIEADIIIKIINREDPCLFITDLSVKNKINKTETKNKIQAFLKELRKSGIIYDGSIMQVKIRNA